MWVNPLQHLSALLLRLHGVVKFHRAQRNLIFFMKMAMSRRSHARRFYGVPTTTLTFLRSSMAFLRRSSSRLPALSRRFHCVHGSIETQWETLLRCYGDPTAIPWRSQCALIRCDSSLIAW